MSYQHGIIDEKKRKGFLDDIEVVVQKRAWDIKHSESFSCIIIVSGNVWEVSLYILGACLATVPNIEYLLKSVHIFEKLQSLLKERRQDINFPNLQFIKRKTHLFLLELYTFIMIYYWNNLKDLDNSIKYANKIIEIDENNFNAHQNMAVFQWLKGKKDDARFHTKRAWRIIPGHPLPRLNKAFFFLCDKKYELALKQYKKIEYVGDTNIIDVVEFLEKEFEKYPNNLGFLFAVGWLNFHYADQIRGINQLEEFLKQSCADSKYATLVVEYQKILGPNSTTNI